MIPENFKDLPKEQKILLVAKYIIENKATVELTANIFNISISSVKKYINNPENLQSIDMNIYNAVKKVQEDLIIIGQFVGGKNGIRTYAVSDFEAMEIAETMIEDGLTLVEASKVFNIPPSTIHERVRGIKDEDIQNKLDKLFNENNTRFGNRIGK